LKPLPRKWSSSAELPRGAKPTPNCSAAALSKPRLLRKSRPATASREEWSCST
jgi:hypothetical protein